jgi:hypothetical protein
LLLPIGRAPNATVSRTYRQARPELKAGGDPDRTADSALGVAGAGSEEDACAVFCCVQAPRNIAAATTASKLKFLQKCDHAHPELWSLIIV